MVEITSLPATSNTGTYTLEWNVVQGLASNVSIIKEESASSTEYYYRYDSIYSWNFTGKPYGTYSYRVSVGGSAYSDPESITVSLPTIIPVSLSGPSTATGPFDLTWTYNWPALIWSDHYELEYSETSATSGFQVLAIYPNGDRRSPFTDTITPEPEDFGKTFYFRVRAFSIGTYTPYSNVISVYIPAASTLPAPTNLDATQGNFTDKIHVGWDAVPGADSYNVYWDTDAQGQFPLLGNTYPFDPTEQYIIVPVEGITQNRDYYFKVSAVDAQGNEGILSGYVLGWASCPQTLPAPTNLGATQGDFTNKIHVAWNAVPCAESYNVYWDTDVQGQFPLLGNTYPFDPTEEYIICPVEGITPNTYYYFKVAPVNAQGNEGALSGYVRGLASSSTPTISAPYWVDATDGLNRYINVQWTSSQNAVSYKVYRSTQPNNPTYIGYTTGTSIFEEMPDIQAWVSYYYWVKAVDSQGNESPFSVLAHGACIDWGAPD